MMKMIITLLAITASVAAEEIEATMYLQPVSKHFYVGICRFVQGIPSETISIQCIIGNLAPGNYVVIVHERDRSEEDCNFLGSMRKCSREVRRRGFRFFELPITKESHFFWELKSTTASLLPHKHNSIVDKDIALYDVANCNTTNGYNVDDVIAYGHVLWNPLAL